MSFALVGCGKNTESTAVTEVEEGIEKPTESVEETEELTEVVEESQYTYTDLSQTVYAQSKVNVRDLPEQSGGKLGSLTTNQEVTVTGQCNETGWYRISYNGGEGFVSNSYLGTEQVAVKSQQSSQSAAEATQAPAQAASAPAEAPAQEAQTSEVDTSTAVTVDRQLEYGETLTPDSYICPICEFETVNAEEYDAHLATEGIQ